LEAELINKFRHTAMNRYSTCVLLWASALGFQTTASGQQAEPDSVALLQRELVPLVIEATRAHERVPITFTDVDREEISRLNSGQDLPYLLRFTPSLVVTSDAGNGIGYTGMWIRGSDPSRVNISVNGIPLNDPESQQVFWVNIPDIASSSRSIQIQRGVGTSSNGSAAFGGLIKIETTGRNAEPYARVENAVGSFSSRKHSVQLGTGLLGGRFILEGRLSRVESDGYIDRARTDLFGYEVTGTVIGRRSELVLTAFGGREETYQSWYGTPAEKLEGAGEEALADFAGRNGFTPNQLGNLLRSGRTYNFYTYDNQVDNYGQDHLQLHYRKRFQDNLYFTVSGHYTRGKGYFEEYREDDSRVRYGLDSLVVAEGQSATDETDLIRRRWLDNHFYGGVFSLRYASGGNVWTAGGAVNEYRGLHFGEITWMEWAGGVQPGDRYYEGSGVKRDANVYVRYIHDLRSGWDVYGDIQLRSVSYRTSGTDNDLREYSIDDNLLFFNPKAGINRRFGSAGRAYASVALGSKEPNRNDYVDAPAGVTPRAEFMTDVESGIQADWNRGSAGVNFFYMHYRDQLVLTGELNDVGAPLRTNVPRSFRTGVELEAQYHTAGAMTLLFNATLSENRIQRFSEVLYDYTDGFDVITYEHVNTPISFSPRAVAMAGVMKRFEIGRRGRTEERSPGLWFEVSWMQKYVGSQFLDNTGNEAVSIEAYTTGDAVLSLSGMNEEQRGWRVNLWVNNVLGAEYASNGYTYGYIYESRVTERFYYPQAGRHYMLGLNLLF
jgi:iron complex outermembrane recepter protein